MMAIALSLLLTVTTACGGAPSSNTTASYPSQSTSNYQAQYSQIQRGNTPTGQQFGDWVVQTSKGLVQDAYVRDNNKLGVVISKQVPPNEVRPLARSLVQGFSRNVPNQDVNVLVYAPDKQLILTARYDAQSRQIEYQ